MVPETVTVLPVFGSRRSTLSWPLTAALLAVNRTMPASISRPNARFMSVLRDENRDWWGEGRREAAAVRRPLRKQSHFFFLAAAFNSSNFFFMILPPYFFSLSSSSSSILTWMSSGMSALSVRNL